MRELEEEYGDQVDFVVLPAKETARRGDEIEMFGFTKKKHGLVVFRASGEVAATLPGHEYQKPEIEEALQTVIEE